MEQCEKILPPLNSRARGFRMTGVSPKASCIEFSPLNWEVVREWGLPLCRSEVGPRKSKN